MTRSAVLSRSYEGASLHLAPAPVLEERRATGLFTIRTYDADIAPYQALYSPTEALMRFAADHPATEIRTVRNLLVAKGVAFLYTCATGAGVNPGTTAPVTNNANNYLTALTAGIGVGDGGGVVPTAASSDTDLTGTTNVFYTACVGAPTINGNVLTATAAISAAQANFVVNEIIFGNFATSSTYVQGLGQTQTAKISATPGSAAYSLISHKGQALGTKSAGQTWTITYTITIS